jgi:membrane protein
MKAEQPQPLKHESESAWHRTAIGYVRRLGWRLRADRLPRLAAALSFTTVLALVPLVTVVVSTMTLFPVFDERAQAIQDWIYSNFVPAASDVIELYLTEFIEQSGKLTALGLVFLLVASLMALATIEDAMNDIWRVHRGRSLFQRVLVYWAVISLAPILIVASLSVSSYFFSLPLLNEQAVIVSFGERLLRIVPFILESGAFILIYMAMPNAKVNFGFAFIGGVVCALLFEIAKRGFAFYLLNFDSYEVVYGALATVPIFLVWIYICWLIVLIGAEIVASLHDYFIADLDNHNA